MAAMPIRTCIGCRVNSPRKICFDLCGMQLETFKPIQRVNCQDVAPMYANHKRVLMSLSSRRKSMLTCEAIFQGRLLILSNKNS